jgi:hypothetical protein
MNKGCGFASHVHSFFIYWFYCTSYCILLLIIFLYIISMLIYHKNVTPVTKTLRMLVLCVCVCAWVKGPADAMDVLQPWGLLCNPMMMMMMMISFFPPFSWVMEHRWNEIDRGKLKYSGKNLSQCRFVHHISHVDWPGPPQWEAGD